MRSSTRLINVLVAALLFVTPLTFASAQSGNDGYDAYFNFAAGGAAAPIVLPWMGERTGTLGDAFADASVFVAPIRALAPDTLPVTGASFDEASALRDAYADLRATGDLIPDALPATGADLSISALPDMEPYEFAVSGNPFADDEPAGLPVTGADGSSVLDDVVRYELAASGIVLDEVGEPTFLPQTGLDASTLPDVVRYELAVSGVLISTDREPVALPQTGVGGDVIGFQFDGSTYVPDVASAALPEVLPQTGSTASGVADWVSPDLEGYMSANTNSEMDWVKSDQEGYGVALYFSDSAAVASEPLALPATGFIWPDDVTYITGDSLTYNDSGASKLSSVPAVLPQTGTDGQESPTVIFSNQGADDGPAYTPITVPETGSGRLDVVGGR
jgi:hypothetical protein